jgi:hypothetical protein
MNGFALLRSGPDDQGTQQQGGSHRKEPRWQRWFRASENTRSAWANEKGFRQLAFEAGIKSVL